MPFVTRAGTRIHYELFGADTIEGRANAVVLLQGLGLSARFWFTVPKLVSDGKSATGEDRLVITIDNRGTGRSGRPRPPWSLATMADDVACVLDVENVQSAIIVGISMGGMIAQHVALRHPTRVRGLVLMATSPGFLANRMPEPMAMVRLLAIPFGGKGAGRHLARLLLPKSKWGRAKEIFREWPSLMAQDRTPPGTFVAHLLAAFGHYVAPRLSSITCPVIVVAGEADSLIPMQNAQSLARRIPGAELELLPDTGHALFAEDYELATRLVLRLEKTILKLATNRSRVDADAQKSSPLSSASARG